MASNGLDEPRYRRAHEIQLRLKQPPIFCCCGSCIGLGVEDARRLRHVLALTKAIMKTWR